MNTSQLLLNLPIHPRLRHPLTGGPLQALGRRADGRLIWPIMGGAPDAGDGGEGGSGGDAGQSGGQAGGDAGQAGQTGGDAGQQAAGASQAGAEAGQQQTAEKVEDLPDWAQKTIRDLRKESGDRRTQATTAEQERTKLLDGIAQALGLKKGEEAPTPEQLASELTTTRTERNEAAVELAVFKGALTAGADPIGLTDSRSFMTKVGKLDPAAKDFATKVKAEIETAISENPKLKAGRAPGASSVDHAGGTGDQTRRTSSKPLSLDQAVSSHYGTS